MKEQRSENLSLIVPDEVRFKEKAKVTLATVIGHNLQREIDEQEISENRRDDFIASRLPIYKDALMRGKETVEQRLQSGELGYEFASGWKQFYPGPGGVYWRLTAKSQDPFEATQFYQNLRSRGYQTAGKTELLWEPELVNMMLQEGFSEQNWLFREFMSTGAIISYTQEVGEQVLNYLQSPLEGFESIEKVYRTISEISSDFNKKNYFISRVLLPESFFQKDLKLARDLAYGILALNRLFLTRNGIAVKTYDTYRYQNSLICELYGNPNPLPKAESLRTPQTTEKAVDFFNKLVADIENMPDELQKTRQRWLLADWIVNQHRKQLETCLTKLGIPQELGLEYIFKLALNRLKKPVVEVNFTSEELIQRRSEKTQRPSPERVTVEDFADDFSRKRAFPHSKFRALDAEDQKKAVERVITQEMRTPAEFRNKMALLMGILSLELDAKDKKFLTIKRRQESNAEEFLKICLAKIEQSDDQFVSFFDDYITRISLEFYIKEQGLPTDSDKELINKLRKPLDKEFVWTKTKEEMLQMMVDPLAAFVLWGRTTTNLEFRTINETVRDHIREFCPLYRPVKRGTHTDVVLFFEGQERQQLEKLVVERIPRLFQEFQQDYFGGTTLEAHRLSIAQILKNSLNPIPEKDSVQ